MTVQLKLAQMAAGAAASAALGYWFSQPEDAWKDNDVFNARMRDMQALAEALQAGFAKCPAFLKNAPLLQSWRGARDGFSKFYGDIGTRYLDPNESIVAQAKDYAARFYQWNLEYTRICGGPNLAPTPQIDPYAPPPPADTGTDWVGVAKWSAIGISGAFLLKTLSELFAPRRP